MKAPPLYAEWMLILRHYNPALSMLDSKLRDAQILALNSLIRQDEAILSVKSVIQECRTILGEMHPITLRNAKIGMHPFLDQMVTSAMNTGSAGWKERGFATSAMRLINCVALMLRIVVTLEDIQKKFSFDYMAAPQNQWVRSLYRIDDSNSRTAP